MKVCSARWLRTVLERNHLCIAVICKVCQSQRSRQAAQMWLTTCGLNGLSVRIRGTSTGEKTVQARGSLLHSTFFVCLSFGVLSAAATAVMSVFVSDALLPCMTCFWSPNNSLRCSAGLMVPISPRNLRMMISCQAAIRGVHCGSDAPEQLFQTYEDMTPKEHLVRHM